MGKECLALDGVGDDFFLTVTLAVFRLQPELVGANGPHVHHQHDGAILELLGDTALGADGLVRSVTDGALLECEDAVLLDGR